MGLYFRKSVKIGPLRFNLSGSGVGVSCGIPGLRIGTGPRGTYISAGRGGIYYRKTLSSPPKSVNRAPISEAPAYDPTIGDFQAITSGTSSTIYTGCPATLIEELNRKRKRARLAPWILPIGLVASILMVTQDASVTVFVIVIGLISAAFALSMVRDAVRKSSVFLYDLDNDMQRDFGDLTAAFEEAGGAARIWHVSAAASVYDRKYHVGALTVLDTKVVQLTKSSPEGLKTNIFPLAIPIPSRTLYFFPDRAILRDKLGYASIEYPELHVEMNDSTFVTGETRAPRDATVLEYTWQFVNSSAGPDRRFRNNPQLPKIKTRDLMLTTGTGFREQLKFSNINAASRFANQLGKFASKHAAIIPSRLHTEVAQADQEGHEQIGLLLHSAVIWGLVTIALATLVFSLSAVNTSSTSRIAGNSSRAEEQTAGHNLPRVNSAPNATTTPELPQYNPTPSKPTSTAPVSGATSQSLFVHIISPVTVKTPSGRLTLEKGLRLPVTTRARSTVTVHYFDGRNYQIPITATDLQ